jgi:hypothetical protein
MVEHRLERGRKEDVCQYILKNLSSCFAAKATFSKSNDDSRQNPTDWYGHTRGTEGHPVYLLYAP